MSHADQLSFVTSRATGIANQAAGAVFLKRDIKAGFGVFFTSHSGGDPGDSWRETKMG
jgi:hypothetical protein